MSQTLLIAPAWLGRSGLWLLDAKGRRKAVDAEDVGLSEARSRFPDAVEQLAWEAEGAAIAEAVRAELGDGWTVTTDLTGWQEMTKP